MASIDTSALPEWSPTTEMCYECTPPDLFSMQPESTIVDEAPKSEYDTARQQISAELWSLVVNPIPDGTPRHAANFANQNLRVVKWLGLAVTAGSIVGVAFK